MNTTVTTIFVNFRLADSTAQAALSCLDPQSRGRWLTSPWRRLRAGVRTIPPKRKRF